MPRGIVIGVIVAIGATVFASVATGNVDDEAPLTVVVERARQAADQGQQAQGSGDSESGSGSDEAVTGDDARNPIGPTEPEPLVISRTGDISVDGGGEQITLSELSSQGFDTGGVTSSRTGF